ALPIWPLAATMSEYVLPCTDCGKCLDARRRSPAGVACGRFDDRWLVATQEGIGALFQRNAARQGNPPVASQLLHYLQSHPDVVVVRLHGPGKAQVGLRVLVGTVDAGVVRQMCEPLQG